MFKLVGLNIFYLFVDEYGMNLDDLIDLYKKYCICMVFLNLDY